MITTAATTAQPFFLFYIIDQDGRSYFQNPDGQVQRSATPAPLGWSPEGWEDLSLGYERNLEKFGLVRSFSASLGFVGDGAQILKHILWNANTDAKAWLLVQRRELDVTAEEFGIVHRLFYKGEIDFTTFKQAPGKVTVNIMEGGRSKELKAGETQAQELALDADPEAIRVKMPGIAFEQSGAFGTPAGLEVSNVTLDYFAWPLAQISVDGSSTGVLFGSQDLQALDFQIAKTSENYLAKVDDSQGGPITLQISGTIKYKVLKNTIGAAVWVQLMTATTAGPRYRLYPSGQVGQVETLNVNAEMTLAPGEKLFLQGALFAIQTGAVEIKIETQEATDFRIAYKNTYPGSFVKMLRPSTAFRRFIGKLCGSEAFAVSSLLESCSFCLTSGDALRGLPGAVLKSTFSEFFSSYRARLFAGLGIEGDLVVLERARYFLDNTTIIDLGEVKELEAAPAADLIVNAVKAGYADQSFDKTNGRLEFNSEQRWNAPPLRAAKELDLTCLYRADPIGAEYTRINFAGKKTTDDQSDNDVWLVDVDLANPQTDAAGTYYNLRPGGFSHVESLPAPSTVFNYELSPKRGLLAWGDYLRSIWYGYESGALVLGSAKKNKDLVTVTPAGLRIAEAEALRVPQLGALLFHPVQLAVKTQVRGDLPQLLKAAPTAVFRFTYRGATWKGWLLKGAIQPKTREEQAFLFLSHPDNDLKQLEYAD